MTELNEELKQLMKQGLLEKAVSLANEHREDLLNDFDGSWNAGWVCSNVGRYTEAISHLERACSIDNSHWAAFWALGVVWYKLEDYDSAEKYFLDSLALKSSYLVRGLLGCVYLKTGQIEQAEQLHLEGLEERRTKERLEYYSDFLYDTGRPDEGERVLAESTTAPIENKKRRKQEQSQGPEKFGRLADENS